MGTGAYLTLKDKPNSDTKEIQLSKKLNESNLFALYPVDKQTSSRNWVQYLTFFRVRHSSGLWLSGNKENRILDPKLEGKDLVSKTSHKNVCFEVLNPFFLKKTKAKTVLITNLCSLFFFQDLVDTNFSI